jgi:hypothetical protein
VIPSRAVQAETILFSDRASWSAAISGVTTIDFEGVPPGAATLVGPTYATEGAVFTVANGALYLADPACCLPYATTDVLSNQGVELANLLIRFPSGTSGVALDFNVDFTRDVRYTLTSGGSQESGIIHPAIRPNLAFFGLTSTAGIEGLRLETVVPGVGFLNVDNVAFGAATPAPVPEPASLGLVAAGLGAAAFLRLRGKKRP